VRFARELTGGLSVLAAVLWLGAAPAVAAELRVKVTGLRSTDGAVHFALYDGARGFPTEAGKISGTKVKAVAGGVVAVFSSLAPGTYAVAVYHDENGNGAFDQGLFGLPLEDYGFSNDAPVWFGPPDFAEAAFAVEGKVIEIAIRLD